MPDTAEVSTDIGIAQNSAAAATDAQISLTALEIAVMMSSFVLREVLAPIFLPGRATCRIDQYRLKTKAILHVFWRERMLFAAHSGHRVAKVGRIDKIDTELSNQRSGVVAMAGRGQLK